MLNVSSAFKTSHCHPCWWEPPPQTSIIYGQEGVSPFLRAIQAGLLPASFGEQKCSLPPSLPKGRPRRPGTRRPSGPPPGSLTMGPFTATSASVKQRDTIPATAKLQFIKPGIGRRKRRRTKHGGEGDNGGKSVLSRGRRRPQAKEGPAAQRSGRAEPGAEPRPAPLIN